jgi:ABC-type transport system substrate-binding protein
MEARIQRRRTLLGLGVVAALTAFAIACQAPAAAPTGATPAAGKTGAPTPAAGTPAKSAEPTARVVASINPHVTASYRVDDSGTAGQTAQFYWPMYDGLVWVDREGKLQPGLARAWRTTDAQTWTFDLREDVKFHNNSAFTAEDVVKSFEWYRNPEARSRNSSLFPTVDTIRAIDAKTVEIKLRQPQPSFVKLIALALVFDASEDIQRAQQQPIGTGPYKFVQFKEKDVLEFEAMPSSFVSPRGPAPIKNLVIRAIPEEATLASAVHTGEIEIGYPINSPDLVNALRRDGYTVKVDPGSAQIHLTFDMSKAPMNDIRVRRALNLAVNRAEILERVQGGFGELDAQLIGKEVLGYNPNIRPFPFDQAQARQLLAEAGFANGFNTRIRYTDSLGDTVAAAIAANLRQVGVNAELQRIESAVWLDEYYARQDSGKREGLWMGVTNWEQTFEPDPVWRWWSADIPLGGDNPRVGGRRWDGEPYERFNALYQRAKATIDEQERGRLYQEAGAYLNSQIPVLFLWRFGRPAAMRQTVDWTPGLYADAWTRQITKR